MSERVLIIGGSGFLGSALRSVLATNPFYTVFFSSTHSNLKDEQHICLNLLSSVEAQILQQFDIIINLTGQVTNPLSTCLRLNTQGIWNLLDAVRHGHQRVIQISSTLVYGSEGTCTAASPLEPDSAYAAAKSVADACLLAELPRERLAIFRLSNLYGPGQHKGLPWYILSNIIENKEIVITDNDGNLCRYFLHSEDAAHIIHRLMEKGIYGVANIPGPECLSIRDFIAVCEKILQRSLPARYADCPSGQRMDIVPTYPEEMLYTHSLAEYLRRSLL